MNLNLKKAKLSLFCFTVTDSHTVTKLELYNDSTTSLTKTKQQLLKYMFWIYTAMTDSDIQSVQWLTENVINFINVRNEKSD